MADRQDHQSILIRQLQGRVRSGTGTVTITNGTNNSSGSIPHGFSVAPTAITATARVTGAPRDDFFVTITSRDATNFVVNIRGAAAEVFAVANPTTVTFDWIAVA